MAEQKGSGERPVAADRSEDSLTQLLARILNQLSVSAWLPAAAVVFVALLYGNLGSHQDNLTEALKAISSMGWGSLILSVGAVVLVTMLTQAFGFEMIRLLEGYWGAGWIGGSAGKLCCRWQFWRRKRLYDRLRARRQVAFDRARRTMLSQGDISWMVPILEASVYENPPPPTATREEIVKANERGWEDYARPGDVYRCNALGRRIAENYPKDARRLLPTRLGNVLRASEDRVYDPDRGSLEGFVQRDYHRLPGTMQSKHDQVRSRLDLYCTLVLVFFGSALAAFAMLHLPWPAVIAALSCSGLGLMSYRAAIASARAYGTMLETIADYLRRHPEEISCTESSAAE